VSGIQSGLAAGHLGQGQLYYRGFQHEANLDEGGMWLVAFALVELTADEEARIGALVKKAVS